MAKKHIEFKVRCASECMCTCAQFRALAKIDRSTWLETFIDPESPVRVSHNPTPLHLWLQAEKRNLIREAIYPAGLDGPNIKPIKADPEWGPDHGECESLSNEMPLASIWLL